MLKENNVKELNITINNWKNYVARSEIKNPGWFRLDRDFYENETYFDLSPVDRAIFVYLLCQATKVNTSGSFNLKIPHAIRFVNVTYEEIMETIHKLEIKGVLASEEVTLRACNEDVTDTLRTRALRNGTLRNNNSIYREDSTEIVDSPKEETFGSLALKPNVLPIKPDMETSFNFNSLYQNYPLKKGDGVNGLKLCFNFIKTKETFDLVYGYINRYRDYVEKNKVEEQFIMNFYNFIHKLQMDINKQPWCEYIKKPELSALKPNKQRFEDSEMKNQAILIANDIISATNKVRDPNDYDRARDMMGGKAWAVVERFGGWNNLINTVNPSNVIFIRSQLTSLAKALLTQKEEDEKVHIVQKSTNLDPKSIQEDEYDTTSLSDAKINIEDMNVSDEVKYLFKNLGLKMNC